MAAAPPTIPPYIPILWCTLKSKLEISNDVFLTSAEQDPPSLALKLKLKLL